MAITFAGVPLSDGTTPAHPEVQSWLEWQKLNLRAQNVFPLSINTWNGIAQFGGYGPDMPIRPQVLHWPVNATRWAHFHILANQDQVNEIRKKAPSGTATLKLSWYDASGILKGEVAPSMTLLSPRPVSEETKSGLFLLTFVDDRYFWWMRQTPSTGTSTVDYTWPSFFSAMASSLGISPSQDTVASVYNNPPVSVPDAIEFIPAAMDCAAFYFGHRIARSLSGTVYTRTPDNSLTDADNNAALGTYLIAGSNFRVKDLHFTLPSIVKLHFPRSDTNKFDVVTTTTGPYAATGSAVVATAGPTLVELSVAELIGIVGNGKTKDLLTTYQADYSSGSLGNQATMDSLTAQMASDYYLWSILRYDKKWLGIIPLDPDCYHDIEWTYSGEEISTRMIPFQYEPLYFTPSAGSQTFNNSVTFNGPTVIYSTSTTAIFNGPIRQKRYAVTISANTDNLALGTANGSWVDATTSGGSYNLTGMTGGSDGRIVEITNNRGGSGTLTLPHDSASSDAANRYYTPDGNPVILQLGETAIAKYSSTASRWILFHLCCPMICKDVTDASYTYLNSDKGKLVTRANTSLMTDTLPQAGTAGFGAGYYLWVYNKGTKRVTITPTTSTINGAATLVLPPLAGALLISDGTNYCALIIGGDRGVRVGITTDTTISTGATTAITFSGESYDTDEMWTSAGGAGDRVTANNTARYVWEWSAEIEVESEDTIGYVEGFMDINDSGTPIQGTVGRYTVPGFDGFGASETWKFTLHGWVRHDLTSGQTVRLKIKNLMPTVSVTVKKAVLHVYEDDRCG